ncbi:hypothetical protein ACROYT_G008844 [Oculina patagonica]
MDFDQTQAIDDYEEEEEEQVEEDKANPKKREVAYLKVFSQQGFQETIFPVFQGDNVIGRDGKCNITVPIKALSKKHACIEVQRDLHLLYDCGSKNRTKKGKSFLKPTVRYELKHGDMLTLGDVKCQYLVSLDMEEEDEDETGSETGSESMLQDVNTEEKLDLDKPIVTEDASTSKKINQKDDVRRDELLQTTEDHQTAKPTKDDEEAYAADTDSDTDEERPLAVAAMATVLYSSEDEQETPRRQQVTTSIPSKGNNSMEGQTLAFGLGSPCNVFKSRDSTDSPGSHPGQTASVPPTLMLSTESDSQSDGKHDVSSDQDNKSSSFKHPGARGSGTQPPSDPTLLYGSESDDGSPIKRPKHPEARVSDKGPSCEPTLLYGSESDDGTPKKKPGHQGTSNAPTLLYESDPEEGTCTGAAPKESDARGDGQHNQHATDDQTLLYSEVSEGKTPSLPAIALEDVGDDSPEESAERRPDNMQEATVAVKDSDATLPYAEAEMSSTDDEGDSEAVADDKKINLDETPADVEPTLAYTVDSRKEDSTDDEQDSVDADDYGADIATQAYAADNVDSDSEAESEPIPLGSEHTAPESDANQPAKPSDLEATQAYCVEEEDSDSSDSQPLPIGTTATSSHDDILATMAYGLEATQAYDVSEKDGDSDESGDKYEQDNKPTLAYDLQATQAYGAGDDDDDEDTRESHQETVQEPSANADALVNKSETDQPTIAYGLEATQAYGANDETDDEETDNEDRSSTGGDQGRGHDANAATLAYGLDPTQPYGGDDDNDNDDDDNKDDKDSGNARQDFLATLPYGLEETQAYDGDNNDADSAQNSMVEATQAYGIEEPSEAELQAQRSERATKTTNKKRVAFASSSTEVTEADETEVDVPVIDKGDQSKPSTSTAADVEDYLPDSEDLIPPPRSRSKRGRKKPVIEESQEETSQQSDKLEEPMDQSESVVESSSAGITEQMDETSEAPEGKDKMPLTKPATRRGRRGAMRVTIEPEEPQEEEERETSTRKGRRGVMTVTNETEDQEENVAKETSAAGRKRGRQTAKTTSVAAEEEEETPVTKSRRGWRGKAVQSETTSVSETPLKTPTGSTAVVTDSVTAATVVVEPTLNVRRGGRGRGRKGVTAKETAQTAQGDKVPGTSVEPQPESHIEDAPTRGKGRGKGRGKKSQPSVNESMTKESLDAEVPAIPDEMQPEQALTTPARGKGRGKGRGKKPQPKLTFDPELDASTSSSPHLVPETPAINYDHDDALPPPESPVVAAASKGKGRGRQGRGRKTQPSVTELEACLNATEETSQPESNSGSRESSQTRKGRGKGKVPKENTEQNSDITVTMSKSTELSETIGDSEESSTAGSSKGGRRGRQRKDAVKESESVEVEETPAKKSRRGKEPAVNRSPSLNRGKPSVGSGPKIMFTGLVDKQGEKVVTGLGGQLVDNIHNCTHLVTDKVRRTVKFLCGLAGGQIIVLPSWLDACKKAKSFVDTSPFLVKDKDAEKQYKFNLQRSHEVALTKAMLEGYKIHVTKKVKPEPSQMKG